MDHKTSYRRILSSGRQSSRIHAVGRKPRPNSGAPAWEKRIVFGGVGPSPCIEPLKTGEGLRAFPGERTELFSSQYLRLGLTTIFCLSSSAALAAGISAATTNSTTAPQPASVA